MPRKSLGARPVPVTTPEPLWERRCLAYPPEWREIILGALRVLCFGYYYDPDVKEQSVPVGTRIFHKFVLEAQSCESSLCSTLLNCADNALASPEPIVTFLTCLISELAASCASELVDKLESILESLMPLQFRQVNLSGAPTRLEVSRDNGVTWDTIFQVQDLENVVVQQGNTASGAFTSGTLSIVVPRGVANIVLTSTRGEASGSFDAESGTLTINLPEQRTILPQPAPIPSTDEARCGAARFYAERLMALSAEYATRLSTFGQFADAALAAGAAITAAVGLTVAPATAVIAALVSLVGSVGATVISSWQSPTTQDAIAESVFCLLRNGGYPTALEIGNALSARFSGLQGTWFKTVAESLGNDATDRILDIGARDPSPLCAIYPCAQFFTVTLQYTTGAAVHTPPSITVTYPSISFNPFFVGVARIALPSPRRLLGVSYELGNFIPAAAFYLLDASQQIMRGLPISYGGTTPPPPYPEVTHFIEIHCVGGEGIKSITFNLEDV